uniref:Uncharacterized protein n=1 Tax=Marmota marmota marmota TaxID=9994 RepID=A0A8C5ZAE8_MARMA
ELKGHRCIVFLTVFLPNPVTVILDFAGRSDPPDTALDKGQGRFVYSGDCQGQFTRGGREPTGISDFFFFF